MEHTTTVQTGRREAVRCYNCSQQGHIASRCAAKVVLYTAFEQPKPNADGMREELDEAPPMVIKGEVDGVPVRDILVGLRHCQ